MNHLDLYHTSDDVDALRKINVAAATAELRKAQIRSPRPSDTELLKRGLARQIDRTPGGVGSAHRRIVVGEVESPHMGGRVFVEHDQGADVILLHGITVHLSDIDRDLRVAFVAASAHFAEAQTSMEQSDQKALVGVCVDSILQRHDFIGAKVREKKFNEKFDF